LDKELGREVSVSFDKHIEYCKDCKQLFENVRDCYVGIEENIITEVNPFFYTRVKSTIEGQRNQGYTLIGMKKLILSWGAYIIIGFFAVAAGYLIANDKSYIEDESAIYNYEMSDEELFADSHYLTLSTDDLYVVTTDEIE